LALTIILILLYLCIVLPYENTMVYGFYTSLIVVIINIRIYPIDVNPSSCSENIFWTNKQIFKEKILKITKLNFPFLSIKKIPKLNIFY